LGFQPFVIMHLITAATIFGTNKSGWYYMLAWWLHNAPPPNPAIAELLSAE